MDDLGDGSVVILGAPLRLGPRAYQPVARFGPQAIRNAAAYRGNERLPPLASTGSGWRWSCEGACIQHGASSESMDK